MAASRRDGGDGSVLLIHRIAGPRALAGGEQRPRERGEQGAQPLERGDGEDAGGERERAQQQAGERPERPWPDVVVVAEVADPADAEDQRPGGDRDREQPGGEPESATGSLVATSTSMRQLSRSLSVAIARRQQRALVVRGRLERGDVRVEQAVAWRRSSSARRAQAATRRGRPGARSRCAERGAEHEQRGGGRADDAERQAERGVSSASAARGRRRPKSVALWRRR